MSKNREIESKTILNKNVFDELVNAFLVKEDFIQKNYYFDSPNQVLKIIELQEEFVFFQIRLNKP